MATAIAARGVTHLHSLDDHALVERAKAGETSVIGILLQRYNRRLYRIARGILGDDSEAEDVVQESYLRAFRNLAGFRGDSSFATWLTQIAINEALGRRRKRRPSIDLEVLDMADGRSDARVVPFPGLRTIDTPETEASRSELRQFLEGALDELPEAFRIVFVMREIEQLSVEETALHLDIREETVKTRLHRARRLLRTSLTERLGPIMQDTYAFDGARCERITAEVLRRLESGDLTAS